MRVASIILVMCLSGCAFVRPVFVPNGQSARVLKDTKAWVGVVDEDGVEQQGKGVIPAGWFCLPDPGEDQ